MECKKCDLYKCEDDDVVVKKAKEEAERLWMEKEGGSAGDGEVVRRVVQVTWMKGEEGGWLVGWRFGWPDWASWFDGFVERVIE